jgi:hypothetical protein
VGNQEAISTSSAEHGLPHGQIRRRQRSRLHGWTFWLLPIIGLPFVGGAGIQALDAGVSSREVAATDLQNLEADVNLVTVYSGWAVALHWPFAQAVAAHEQADRTVQADLGLLNHEGSARSVMARVGPAVTTYLTTLDGAEALFRPGGPPLDPALENAALAQFDRLHVLIDHGTATLNAEAAGTANDVRAAVWSTDPRAAGLIGGPPDVAPQAPRRAFRC